MTGTSITRHDAFNSNFFRCRNQPYRIDNIGKTGFYEYGRLDKNSTLPLPPFTPFLKVGLYGWVYNGIQTIQCHSIGKDNLDSLVEFFKDYAARGKSTIVISFDKDIIDTLYKECPEQTYWLLTSELSDEAVDFCKNHGNMRAAFNGNNAKNTDSVINAAIDAGIPLAAWTIDNTDTLKHLYSLGIRYFTTNRITP